MTANSWPTLQLAFSVAAPVEFWQSRGYIPNIRPSLPMQGLALTDSAEIRFQRPVVELFICVLDVPYSLSIYPQVNQMSE